MSNESSEDQKHIWVYDPNITDRQYIEANLQRAGYVATTFSSLLDLVVAMMNCSLMTHLGTNRPMIPMPHLLILEPADNAEQWNCHVVQTISGLRKGLLPPPMRDVRMLFYTVLDRSSWEDLPNLGDGSYYYLAKPFNPWDLLERVKEILDP